MLKGTKQRKHIQVMNQYQNWDGDRPGTKSKTRAYAHCHRGNQNLKQESPTTVSDVYKTIKYLFEFVC